MTYLVVYRKATNHATSKGNVVLKSGADLIWSLESVVHSDDTYDVRDPSISKLADGTVIVSCFIYDHVTPASLAQAVRILISDDSGVTWGSPITIVDGFTDHSACCSPVVELGDGTLLLAFYGKDTGDTYRSIRIVSSADSGATWGNEVVVASGETDSKDYSEPNLLVLSNGNLICLIRTSANIYISTSTDSGDTWSGASSVFVGTGCPHVMQLSTGDLVCCYRSTTNKRAALRVSSDNGANWSDEAIFDTTMYNQMLYAVPIESNGALCIFYALELSGADANVMLKKLVFSELP